MNDLRLENISAVNTGVEMAFYLEISKVVASSRVSGEIIVSQLKSKFRKKLSRNLPDLVTLATL